MKKSKNLWRGLTTVMAVLLALMIGGQSIANAQAGYINGQLGTTNTKVVEKEGGAKHDATYFDSEFKTLDELVAELDKVAAEVASEGVVLLKNHNEALPIDKAAEKVTLWGLNSHTPTLGGMIGSSTGFDAEHGQIAYGVEEALKERGFELNADFLALYSSDAMNAFFRRGFGQTGHGLSPAFGMIYENAAKYPVGEMDPALYTEELLATADGTAAIVVISRDSSEAADYHPDMVNGTAGDAFERPLALSNWEREMIKLAKAHSTKVVVLVNADNPMEIEELKTDDEIDAILWTGAPGLNGFLGAADVLCGNVAPSGHLSDTYAVNSTSSPAMVNYGVYTYTTNSKGSNPVLTTANKADWYLVESENIYNGYKYYETRYEDAILGRGNAADKAGATAGEGWNYADEVSYPFGYGLSYTTFEQSLKSVDVTVGGEGKAVVEIKNTGKVAGKSVAQLYVQSPYTVGGLEKSAVQLIGFAKTDVLQPGASQTLTVTFDPQYIASYDETAVKADGTVGAWVLDAGDYYFAIGNGAHEALNNILAKKTGKTDGLVVINDGETITAANAIQWKLAERDIETYSANVQNALQDMDINKFIPGAAEYTTRADWTKGWTPVTGITPTEEMMVGLTNSNYTLNANGEKVVWGADNGLKLIDLLKIDENGNYAGSVAIDDPLWDALMDQITLDEAINFIEMGGNDNEAIASIGLPKTYENDGPLGFTYDQVPGYKTRWTEDLKNEPTYVAPDHKYANRSMNVMPTAPVVAATFNTELIERMGELLGEEGLWANETSIFGPGLNLHRVPYCARNHEYYSEDSVLSNLMAVAVCTGGKSKGIIMEPKHLAFNHQEANRSGLSTFMTEQAARENSLRNFQGVMSLNVADQVMTAFNRAGTVFAGGHKGLLTQIVRNEWGYDGGIITDMINGADYMNWRDVTWAGGGNCLTETAYEKSEIGLMKASKDMIAKDAAFQEMMKTNIKYFLFSLVNSNAMNGMSSNTEFVYVTTWWQNTITAVVIALAVLTVLCAAKYALVCIKAKKNA